MNKLLYALIAVSTIFPAQLSFTQDGMQEDTTVSISVPTMITPAADIIAQASSVNARMEVLLGFINQMHDKVLPIVQQMAQNQKKLSNDLKIVSLSQQEKEVLFSQLNKTNMVLEELLTRVTTIPPQVQAMLTEFSQHTQDALQFLQNRALVKKATENLPSDSYDN